MASVGVVPGTTFVDTPGPYSYQPITPAGVQQTQQEISVNLLNQKHPEYRARYEAWLDLTLLYEGGSVLKSRAERLLKKRPREDEEVFAARMDHLTYQNILGTGLGWYGAAMFEDEPEIFFNLDSGAREDKFYPGFLKNCDGLGTPFIDFSKKFFQTMLTYGRGWVLTDLRAMSDDEPPPKSAMEERQRKLTDPHLAAYTPLDIINWRTNELGELEWACIKTVTEEQPGFLEKRMIVDRWYYFDREVFKVYEDRRSPEEQIRVTTDEAGRTAKLIRGPAPHSLSHVHRVPLRPVSLSGGLWLANRAYLLLLDHLNQDNTLKWALFMSNLAMPIVIGNVDSTNMTYSEIGYLQFPEGTTYEWTEPEGKSFGHSAKRIESLREECFRSMNLQAQGRSMRATPAMQSGRSKILEMAPSRQILSGMGGDLRKHMQEILTDVCDARRDRGIEPDVRGFNFQEDMTTEEVFASQSVLNMRIPSKLFEKSVQKKVAKAWMRGANRDQLEQVYDEIDDGPTIEEQEKEDMRERAKFAVNQIRGIGSGQGAKALPPGRGGSGPSPTNPGSAKSRRQRDKKN